MLNEKVLLTQLSFVQKAYLRLERLSQLKQSEFLANEDNVDLAHHHLRIASEAATDMGRHIIARMGWGQPKNYMDVFNLLKLHSVLSPDLAEHWEELTRFRNILVHRYPLITQREIYQRLQRHLPDIGNFIKEIAQYLQGHETQLRDEKEDKNE